VTSGAATAQPSTRWSHFTQ